MKLTSPKKLSEKERFDWIRLSRTENIGPATFFRLLDVFNSASLALEKAPEIAARVKCEKKVKIISANDVEKELEKTKKFGAEILLYGDEAYPRLVREIDDPAPFLIVKGRKELLNKDSIAIVGPRNSTFHACKFAEQFASDLAQNEIIIVSGLARGVDAAAHRGSLKTGTVAVIAGGIENIYPLENKKLYEQIYEEGLVIAENPFGAPLRGSAFIQRNRIVAGMSYAIVVIEAGIQSGSLTTARFALDQGREVFAIPGFPADPRCAGSNMLLEDGAIFTQNASRVLKEMPALRARFSQAGMLSEPESPSFEAAPFKMPSDADLDKLREEILQRIGFVATSIEELTSELQTSSRLINIALVQLELTDQIIINARKIIKK